MQRLFGSTPGHPLKISFEFFPPKNEEMEKTLWASVERLAPLAPRFVSVTYGAGGTTRERTHATVKRLVQETKLKPAAHLTCVSATRAEIDAVVGGYWEAGVRHIVALRGDPPAGAAKYEPHPGGYAYANDLIAGIRKLGDFEISVGAYPEKHPDSPDPDKDIDYLKAKLDAGATRAITQYFFDTDVFLRYRDKVAARGISAEIVPGILPVTNFAQVVKFSKMCGASVPSWLAKLFEGLDGDPDTRRLVAAMVAAEQCRRLQEHGVDAFHFYTLNRADLAYSICHILGLRPGKEA
ncbi:MAG: methylenetetrahydrofolate reductase [NAD(P)H] [Azospirillum sp.]|nr:methylenetetrahydrofolate reductase [NAD(P)H] [Azospirillum sp.]MCA3266059.1 methylenetetrahydrofolate reductase [NAD(P)H] [Azospirillum sp.]